MLSIKSKIAEGGYSDIYMVKDITEQEKMRENSYFKIKHMKNKQKYILKRMSFGYEEENERWTIRTAFKNEVRHLD